MFFYYLHYWLSVHCFYCFYRWFWRNCSSVFIFYFENITLIAEFGSLILVYLIMTLKRLFLVLYRWFSRLFIYLYCWLWKHFSSAFITEFVDLVLQSYCWIYSHWLFLFEFVKCLKQICNKNAKTKSICFSIFITDLFYCLHCWLWRYCSCMFNVDFEVIVFMSLLFTLKTFLLYLYCWTLIHYYHVFIIWLWPHYSHVFI